MAYIVNTTQTATALAATYTVTLGAHQTNDLLLVLLSQDGGGTNITTASSGWAMIGTGAASGASRSQWAYKVAASGAEANPQFSGANDDWIGTCLVIRDADPTTPFGSLVSGTDFIRTDWNNVGSTSSGSLTTAANECLLIYSWNSDGNLQYPICSLSDLTCVDKYSNTQIAHIIGYRQQQTSGSAPTATMYSQLANEGGNGWVLAVRNKTGGALQPDIRPTMSMLKWHGSWETQQDGITWQSPSNFAASINSITCSANAPTATYATNAQQTPWGNYTALPSTENTASAWVGGTFTIASTNMTGKVFAVQYAIGLASINAIAGSEGVIIGFSDGTNWATYQVVSKSKGWLSSEDETAFIALGNATAYASSGAINWGAVTRIGYFKHRAGSSASSINLFVKHAALFSSVAMTGGGANRPLVFNDYVKAMNSWGMWRWAELKASSQITVKVTTQIGDGTNTTYFDGAAQSIEFPQAWSPSAVDNWQMSWNAAASSVSLAVKAASSDTINLASGVAATDTQQALTIDSASNTGATYSFAQSFVGWSPTWKTGINVSGATFAECAEIDAKGSDWTDCTIKKTASTDAAIAFSEDGGSMTRCTIDVTGTSAAYHLELGTAVTAITLTDHVWAGTPTTDKIHVKKTTGTVTITIAGTTSLSAGDVTSAGATVVISAPQLYQSVTVSGLVAGSRVQIYDTTSSTELSNTTPAGTSVTWTDSNPASADRAIRVRITKVSGATAYEMIEANIGTCGQTEGTESVSYLANQVADSTYNTNAIDGSTVTNITIDDTTNLVKIAIPGGSVTWPQIYAYQVYWLNTATGIQDDFAFIEAPDTANYLLTGFQIKNTSSPSVPLVISSGYGRDATTGASVDLVDTSGGTLIFAPDHVVAFSSGSGLTAGQDSKLSAIETATSAYLDATVSSRLASASYTAPPSASTIATQVLTSAQSTPIHADIKKLNNAKLAGTGASGDKWRGA